MTDFENRRYIAKIDKMMREKHGEKPKGGRPSKENASESDGLIWSHRKTAEKIGVAESTVSEAKSAEAFIEKRPELARAKTPVVLEEKRKEDIIEAVPEVHKVALTRKAKTLDSQELKEVVTKVAEIDNIIEKVQRPELRESLTRRFASAKFEEEIKPERVLEVIRQEKGLTSDQFRKIWAKQIRGLKQTRVGFPSLSEYKEWEEDGWMYASCTTKAQIPAARVPLVRIDLPRSRFGDLEEADAYAKTYGGYGSKLMEIEGVQYWCIYVKEDQMGMMRK